MTCNKRMIHAMCYFRITAPLMEWFFFFALFAQNHQKKSVYHFDWIIFIAIYTNECVCIIVIINQRSELINHHWNQSKNNQQILVYYIIRIKLRLYWFLFSSIESSKKIVAHYNEIADSDIDFVRFRFESTQEMANNNACVTI